MLDECRSDLLHRSMSLYDLMKRPTIHYADLLRHGFGNPDLPPEVTDEVEIIIHYAGYIVKQEQQVERTLKLEKRSLPTPMDYSDVINLRLEARQKLNAVQPETVGQASRISGVNPADITALLVWLEHGRRDQHE